MTIMQASRQAGLGLKVASRSLAGTASSPFNGRDDERTLGERERDLGREEEEEKKGRERERGRERTQPRATIVISQAISWRNLIGSYIAPGIFFPVIYFSKHPAKLLRPPPPPPPPPLLPACAPSAPRASSVYSPTRLSRHARTHRIGISPLHGCA